MSRVYVPVLPPLTASCLGPRRYREWFAPDRAASFRRGREAISAGLAALGLGAGDELLMPASICEAALDPVHAAGIGVRRYRLDSRLRLDSDSIAAALGPAVRAVYVAHYFGFPQEMSAVRELCSAEKLYLIEDCALCFPNDSPGDVGRMGDFSIFSLWKHVPVPDGAWLLVRDEARARALPHPDVAADIEACVELARSVAKGLLMHTPLPPRLLRTLLSDPVDEPAAEEHAGCGRRDYPRFKASRLTRMLWPRLRLRRAASRRRENYRKLLERIASVPGVDPLYGSLPDDVIPFSFPVQVGDPARLQRALHLAGIQSERSLSRPPADGGEYPEVELLAAHVLSLPIHQGVGDAELDAIIRVLESPR